jgi:predicted GNAT family acetyltransferase
MLPTRPSTRRSPAQVLTSVVTCAILSPMGAPDPTQQVVDNPAEGRFEIWVDGALGELTYRKVGKRLVLIHTGVADELEGRGIGGQLVRFALEEAAAGGFTLVPRCPFARSWLERHPDDAARVAIDWPTPESGDPA